jgi:hypothetical protein
MAFLINKRLLLIFELTDQEEVMSLKSHIYVRRIVVSDGIVNGQCSYSAYDGFVFRVWISGNIEVLRSNDGSSCDLLSSLTFESNSRLTRIESRVFFSSSLQSILIPRNVEVISSECFAHCRSLSSISFESNSRLTRIESEAFSNSSLQSIVIPRSVEVLCFMCFAHCRSLSSISFESNSRLTRIEYLAFYESSFQSIVIPRNVEVLCPQCFSFCRSLSSITFESNSRLTRIGSNVFDESSLQSIMIPRSVQFIDGSAFTTVTLSFISIESGNEHFVVEKDFLIDIVHHKLIRYLSMLPVVRIGSDIEILGSSCFSCCTWISSITFESNSRLRRIESQAFNKFYLMIVIPSTVLFVAFDVIPNSSHIFISDSDSCPEFDRWKQLRKSGIAVDFRRILRIGSGFGDLSDYQIDLSVFEEASILRDFDQVSRQRYQRLDDGLMFVVKSKHHWEFVENCRIELENLLNLRHPCIAVPIGFVFPVELSDSRELKIVELNAEEHSLAEVISVNPVWWTATVKAKAVAGIMLGLRFAHSFGLIHGHLNSNNIIFDSDHRIQIADFYPIGLEVEKSEKDASVCVGGFSGNRWLPKTDIRGFGSILFEIIFGHSAKLLDVSNNQMIVHPNVPVFVSEIIAASQSPTMRTKESFRDVFDILKKNDFAILAGVDSADVLSFVNWVESFE